MERSSFLMSFHKEKTQQEHDEFRDREGQPETGHIPDGGHSVF